MSEFLHDKRCEWNGEEPSACCCRVRVVESERDLLKAELEKVNLSTPTKEWIEDRDRLQAEVEKLKAELQEAKEAYNEASAIAKKWVARGDSAEKDCGMLKAEVERLKKDNERLVWNLAGCLTYAEGWDDGKGHNKEMETPALVQVQKLAKDRDRWRTLAEGLAEALEYSCEHGSLKCDKSCEYEKRSEALAAARQGEIDEL